jgi:predicted acetyltransferase
MQDEKLLTIPNLIAALKEAGFATKDDIREATDAVLEGQEGIYRKLGEHDASIATLIEKTSKIEARIDALAANTPTIQRVENLEQRVSELERKTAN